MYAIKPCSNFNILFGVTVLSKLKLTFLEAGDVFQSVPLACVKL